ncbi:MAG: hypothetical protein HN366_03730 [Deltaproteobacteria bacterium]|jgi:hypothetical protein|nr:hypothetical protein [Deltaproteobacteria bacterium]
MTRKAYIAIIVALVIFSTVIYFEKKSPAQTGPPGTETPGIKGRVMSTYGPLENARVRVPGSEHYALTDRQGMFTLPSGPLPGEKSRITAGKAGWFNNVQVPSVYGRPIDIFLNPVYLNDQPDYRFISPVTCAKCHGEVTRYWDRSKMAHTSSNPMVLDMFYGTDALNRQGVAPGYRLDNPKKNGECVACHAPSSAASGGAPRDLKAVLQSPLTEWDGISCDYCHKVRNVIPDAEKPSGRAAVLERQSSKRGSSILIFGPYDDVVTPPMAASYNPLFSEAKFCATCHSHYRKLDGEKGWDPKGVYSADEWEGLKMKNNRFLPIQTTFQEWEQWQKQLPFDDPNKGKKCQDCHMGWRKEMLPYDHYVVDGMARRMWGTYRSPQDIRPHHFDGGTQTQLKTALAMELEGEITGKNLDLNVYITNTNGGHWVPTGETMRSVMLVLNVSDSKGKPLKMIKGGTLPRWAGEGALAQGNYAGFPGAVFARILEDREGNLHAPFWRATGIYSDTRIRPKKTVALKFQFALTDPDDEPTAEADLIYRPVIKPLALKKRWVAEDILIARKVW